VRHPVQPPLTAGQGGETAGQQKSVIVTSTIVMKYATASAVSARKGTLNPARRRHARDRERHHGVLRDGHGLWLALST
jgi:hypothetical protein